MKRLLKVLSVGFYHIERIEIDRTDKRVYDGECVCILLVGRPRKRWIDFGKDS